ncbi:MAG: hypothetical protein DRP56_11085 [Planctomycetota bacterium]|nr:MAG: hypothetical protein DRP56_11085 [Planctomycetota bacterium]
MADFLANIANTILSALGLGGEPQSWATRLREEITLKSPKGNTYTARWSGGTRSVSNNVARFKFPEIPGERVQDLRAGADEYDLIVLFEGENNDINASAFVDELKNNKGNWSIEHPVRGPVSLVWLHTTENMQPVESGNLTIVGSTWIEPLPETAAESAAKAQADAERAAMAANIAAAEQFDAIAQQGTPGQIQAIIDTAGKAVSTINKTLALIENASIIDPRITAIGTAIQNTLDGDLIDTSKLSGQFQALTQIYGLGQTSSVDAISMYENYVSEAVQNVPTQATDDGLAQVATTEMIVSAGLVGATRSALIGGLTSRGQAITAARDLADLMGDTTQALDDIRTLYEDRAIDKKYFSQSGAYADIQASFRESIRFLLFSLNGLPGERLITLTEDKSTLQIAHDEYGAIGNEESETYYLDVLLDTNGLMDDDIYWLPRGRQVLVYA